MRSLLAVLAVAVVMWSPGKLSAQNAPSGLAERIQDLNLTDEQEAKIADIRKEARPKVEEAAKEVAALVKDEVGKIEEVLTPEQRTKIQALKEERKEHRAEGLAERMVHFGQLHLTDAELAQLQAIHKEYRPKVVKAMEELHGLLTDEQKQARAEGLKAGKKRAEIVASLNLTGEQKEKVATVCKDVATLVREQLEKMRDVLNAEQQEKLAELKDERHDRARDRLACAIANFSNLDLTEEQKSKIAAIRTEYRPKVHEAGNKLRGLVREEVEAIVAVLKG
jgi:Spy/CpxP family protein refolding chaperone